MLSSSGVETMLTCRVCDPERQWETIGRLTHAHHRRVEAPVNPAPSGKAPEPVDAATLVSIERQLALVDRVLGLEAQVAELSSSSRLTPSEQLRAEKELAMLRSSLTWRLGRVAAAPISAARRVARGRGGA